MQLCMGVKLDGGRCSRVSREVRDPNAPHLHFCVTHWRTYDNRVESLRERFPDRNPNHVEGMCLCYERRHWCRGIAEPGSIFCERHRTLREEAEQARQERVAEEQRMNAILEDYQTRQPLMTWRQVVDDMMQRPDWNALRPIQWMILGRRVFRHLDEQADERQFIHYWRWRLHGGHGDPPEPNAQPLPAPPLHTLAGLARDRQNVHTRPVSEQTNRGLETLLALRQRTPGVMRSPDWFAAKWLVRSYGAWNVVCRTVDDMYRWYNQPTCRDPNDWLYRKALDGLYLMIRTVPSDETKIELFKRTFEECFESVGLCCDGHITRVCNVLVGFDNAFEPPVSLGELLQAKMAAIAASDLSTDEKIRQAIAFFTEHHIPEADRTAWLEAF